MPVGAEYKVNVSGSDPILGELSHQGLGLPRTGSFKQNITHGRHLRNDTWVQLLDQWRLANLDQERRASGLVAFRRGLPQVPFV